MNGYKSGRLFEPHTLSFNNKVYAESIVAFGGEKSAWIGINGKGGSWVYTSSGTELVLENWWSTFTNPGHDCVYWVSPNKQINTNGKWVNAVDCNYKLRFICDFS